MAYNFLSTVQTVVKRVNSRVNTLVKNFGFDSPIVQDIATKYDVFFRDNYAFKGLTPVLKKPSEIFNDPEMNEKLQELEREIKTSAEIKKEYSVEYKEYKKQAKELDIPAMPQERFINAVKEIPNALTWLYDVINGDIRVGKKKKKQAEEMFDKFATKEKGGKRKVDSDGKAERLSYADLEELAIIAGVI